MTLEERLAAIEARLAWIEMRLGSVSFGHPVPPPPSFPYVPLPLPVWVGPPSTAPKPGVIPSFVITCGSAGSDTTFQLTSNAKN